MSIEIKDILIKSYSKKGNEWHVQTLDGRTFIMTDVVYDGKIITHTREVIPK